jgi:hypothetical protein
MVQMPGFSYLEVKRKLKLIASVEAIVTNPTIVKSPYLTLTHDLGWQ